MDVASQAPVSIRNHLLRALPASELAVMRPHLKELSPRQGTVLQEPGRGFDAVFFPDNALVLLWAMLANGNAVAAAMIGPEGAVGIQAASPEATALTRAVVQCPGRIFYLNAAAYRRLLAECPALASAIARQADRMLDAAHQAVACNAIHDVRQRLGRCLLEAHDRLSGATLPFTQETLAQMLGVRRTTVTLVAGELEQQGLIREGRGRIEVIDPEGLQRASCECYAAMRRADASRTVAAAPST
jgi:CRP-like cAMP-binding protein